MKKLLFTIIASGLVFSACKRDKNDNPNPNSIDNGTKVPPTPIVEIKGIELYNQTLDTVRYPDSYNFYSISRKAYNNCIPSVKYIFSGSFPAISFVW